ncbi:MAG: GHKL domain-containing protein [Oscillospiraceae bacterium]|nr:GHKL domain-containing protein [Oscillospiraceae bacterium]
MNSYWRNLLTYLVSIPSAFLCCSLMRNQFRQSFRRTLPTVIAILLITIPIAAWFDTNTSSDSGIITGLLLCVCFIPFRLAVKCHISKALAVFAHIMAITSLITSVSNGIDAIFNPHAGQNDITVLYIVLQLVLTTVTAFILNIQYRKNGVRLIDRMDIPSVWYATLPTSIACIFLSIAITPYDYSVLFARHAIQTYFVTLFLLALVFITLTFSFYRVCAGILFAARAEERARILEMQKSQFDSQQRYIEESAAVRHDFRQTMYTLRGLLQEKDYDSLNKYFDDFYGTIPENDVIRFCLNQPLNALLNYHVGNAQRMGIDIKLVIDPLEDVSISDVDLCTVVGNILDNAVSACSSVEQKDRFIQLSIVNEGDVNLFIVGSNSFDGTVRKSRGRYLSVKRDGSGIGLSSVASIAERYGGSAEFSNDGSVFYSNVMIPLNNTDAAAED